MGEDGNFYRTQSIAKSKNVRPVALVLYVPDYDADENDKCLAVSLKPLGKVKFSNIDKYDDEFSVMDYCGRNSFLLDWGQAYDNSKSVEIYEEMMNESDVVHEHSHPAAKLVSEYNVFGTEDFDHSKFRDCSDWYLPALSDYLKIALCTGLKYNKDGGLDANSVNVTESSKKMGTLIKAAGLTPNDVFPTTAMFHTTTYHSVESFFQFGPMCGGRADLFECSDFNKESSVQAFLRFTNN